MKKPALICLKPMAVSSERIAEYDLRPFPVEKVLVAGDRGPCGGVNMALEAARQVLEIVNKENPGEKIYSPWDIVHNRPVMDELKHQGLTVFNHDWDLVPDGSIILLPAHGAAPRLYQIAEGKKCLVVDVTCQLVTRVHHLAMNAAGKRREPKPEERRHVVYIGAQGHPETEGVLGELDQGTHTLIDQKKYSSLLPKERIQYLEEVINNLPEGRKVVYSQTTLSPDDVDIIVDFLRQRVSDVEIPSRRDICYAMDNRWTAVRELLPRIDMLLVVGSKHSHNSQQLRLTGEKAGLPSYSVDQPEEINRSWFTPNLRRVGLTAGASVLEKYTEDVIEWFKVQNPSTQIVYDKGKEDRDLVFKLPRESINKLRARYTA